MGSVGSFNTDHAPAGGVGAIAPHFPDRAPDCLYEPPDQFKWHDFQATTPVGAERFERVGHGCTRDSRLS